MIGGREVEKGRLWKMARGELVAGCPSGRRKMWRNRRFDRLGYRYEAALSDDATYVLLRNKESVWTRIPSRTKEVSPMPRLSKNFTLIAFVAPPPWWGPAYYFVYALAQFHHRRFPAGTSLWGAC